MYILCQSLLFPLKCWKPYLETFYVPILPVPMFPQAAITKYYKLGSFFKKPKIYCPTAQENKSPKWRHIRAILPLKPVGVSFVTSSLLLVVFWQLDLQLHSSNCYLCYYMVFSLWLHMTYLLIKILAILEKEPTLLQYDLISFNNIFNDPVYK